MIWTILMAIVGIVLYIFWIIKSDEKDFVGIIGGILLLIWLGLSFLPVYFIGFHYETGKGEHIGSITAVQKQGIFFKTGRAYVKTDIQSSQEDDYCVIDEAVYSKLQKMAEQKEKVKVKYFSWFSAGIKNCESEEDIIYEVELLKTK